MLYESVLFYLVFRYKVEKNTIHFWEVVSMFKKLFDSVRSLFSRKVKNAPAVSSGEHKVLYEFPSAPAVFDAPIKSYRRERAPRPTFSAPAVVSPLKKRMQEIQSIDRKVQFNEWRKNNTLLDELRNKGALA